MKDIQSLPFVFVGLQSWYVDIGSNARNMAEELSKTHDVLFVNPPIDRITVLRKGKDASNRHAAIYPNKVAELQQISPRLWVYTPKVVLESINWIPFGFLHDRANRHNNRLFAGALQGMLTKLGWKDYILLNDNEIMRCLFFKELLKPALSLYYLRDYLMGVPYWYKHGHRIEPQIINKYDAVVANSPQLSSYANKWNQHSYYIGQGCDIEKFRKGINSERPDPLKHITKPIIGYVGALVSWRLDINLIIEIAKRNLDYEIVLVGHEDEVFKASGLHGLSNVTFVQNQPEKLLPSFINAFDIAFNPQLKNEITSVNYPRKIDEYLAIGRPTLATFTPTMKEVFGDIVYLANNIEEYCAAIKVALAENTDAKVLARQEFAAGHTWAHNIQNLFNAITQTVN